MGSSTGCVKTHLLPLCPRFSTRFLILLTMFFWLASLHPAGAQSAADGAIAGHLRDESGSPMPFTLVLAIDPETGLVQKTATGSHGEFIIPRLAPGTYVLAIADSSVELPLPGLFTVHLGEVTEAEPQWISGYTFAMPPLQTSDAALPVVGGDWNSLETTASSTNLASSSGTDASELSVGGLDSAQNGTRVDGASADDSFSGSVTGSGVAEDPGAGSDVLVDPANGPGAGSRSLTSEGRRSGSSYSFAQSAVSEFRIHAQADAVEYGSALYGHGAAAIVTSISRSGGARLHGMALFNFRNKSWTAANPFDIATTYNNGVIVSAEVKPRDIQQQFAARISGPFMTLSPDGSSDVASRVSYLFAFERQLRDDPAISSPASPQFYRLTAMQTALLANRGVSATATSTALNYLSSLTGTASRHASQTIQFGRLDWSRTAGARAVLEYNRVRWDNPGGTQSTAVVNRGTASLGSAQGSIDDAIARLFVFPTPRITNELRLQYSHELQFETPQMPLPQEPAIGPDGFAPQVSIEPDGFLFGTPAALGRHAYPDERRLEVINVLAWAHGQHLVQIGGDFSELRDFTNSLANAEGSFSYDSGTTGGHAGGLVDWITDFTFGVNSYPNGGCPSIYASRHDFCFRSFSQSFGAQSVTWHTQQWSAFLQDDWRPSRLLTLHLGVRYELQTLPSAQHPNTLLDAAFGKSALSSSFPEDRNNYGPRAGLAWQPLGAGRGTIRIGYGLYFGKLPGATLRAALLETALPSSTRRIRITPTTETVCPQNPEVGFGYPCSFSAPPVGVAIAQDTSAIVFARRFSLPAIQQGTLSLEHSLGWGVLGSANYVMNLDRQLAGSSDLNIAPSTVMAPFQLQGGTGQPGSRDHEIFYVPMYSARISSSFGPVTGILSNGNATYNALTLQAQRGLGGRAGLGGTGRGLEFRIAWTWSKALDFAPQSGATPRANGQFDPFTNRYDKSLSALNFPHRIVATAVWSPQPPEAVPPIRALLRDFSIAGIFTETSGRGYSYTVFGGTRLPGGHESINGSGGSTVLPTMGRNTLRLPDSANLDLRIARSFRAGSRFRLRAFADGFNLLNRINYSGVTQRAYIVGVAGTGGAPAGVTPLVFQDAGTIAAEGLNTLPFGTLTDAGAGQTRQRRIQLGLRIEF